MPLLCLKCKKKKTQKVKLQKTKNRRMLLLLKCAVRDSKKSKFIKEPEARILFSSLGIRTPLSKIALVCPVLF